MSPLMRWPSADAWLLLAEPRPAELDGHGLSQGSFEEAVAKYLHSHGID